MKKMPFSLLFAAITFSVILNACDGKMIEEYLFWDNQSFMKQIGVGQ
jgi:hypothetical protein